MAFSLYSRNVKDSVTGGIIALVKEGKGLSGIDDSAVLETMKKFLEQNSKVLDTISNADALDDVKKNKGVRAIVKWCRARLRKATGAFEESFSLSEVENKTFLSSLSMGGESAKIAVKDLLQKHRSTSERVSYIEEFAEFVFKNLEKGDAILDIGAGIDPLISILSAAPLDITISAWDVSSITTDFLNKCFSAMCTSPDIRTKGHAETHDITKDVPKGSFKRVLAFKTFDGIPHKKSEELIDSIDSKEFMISFSTRTISGKRMEHPMRRWLSSICKRRNWKYSIKEFRGEIVYVVIKNGN